MHNIEHFPKPRIRPCLWFVHYPLFATLLCSGQIQEWHISSVPFRSSCASVFSPRTITSSSPCIPFFSGTYKPRVRCFELSEMSMKFERHVTCEVSKLHMLSEDYTKFAMLLADRYVELHAAGGVHYRTRVPHYGRDL